MKKLTIMIVIVVGLVFIAKSKIYALAVTLDIDR